MANAEVFKAVIDHLKIPSNQTGRIVLITAAAFGAAGTTVRDDFFDPNGVNQGSTGANFRVYESFSADVLSGEFAVYTVGFSLDSSRGAGDGTLELHCRKSDFVESAVSDTPIYLACGDETIAAPAHTDLNGRDNVFADAQAAILMESTTPVDSAGNHTMSVSGTLTSIDGPYGKANSFSGSDRVSNSDAALEDVFADYDGTISIISRRSAYAADKAVAAFEGTDDLVIYPMDSADGNGLRVFWRHVGLNIININNESLANTWIWTDFTSRATDDHEGYTNGSSVATSSDSDPDSTTDFVNFYIGGFDAAAQSYDGDIAQVIAWKAAQTSDRLAANVNNQKSPDTFFDGSAATHETIGGTVSVDDAVSAAAAESPTATVRAVGTTDDALAATAIDGPAGVADATGSAGDATSAALTGDPVGSSTAAGAVDDSSAESTVDVPTATANAVGQIEDAATASSADDPAATSHSVGSVDGLVSAGAVESPTAGGAATEVDGVSAFAQVDSPPAVPNTVGAAGDCVSASTIQPPQATSHVSGAPDRSAAASSIGGPGAVPHALAAISEIVVDTVIGTPGGTGHSASAPDDTASSPLLGTPLAAGRAVGSPEDASAGAVIDAAVMDVADLVSVAEVLAGSRLTATEAVAGMRTGITERTT
ncbi:MAG: hypothetical protein MI755_16415 [Sphingomonadales bacterium]|nr:hypothetical protein [Sphingomonadales bacterium]